MKISDEERSEVAWRLRVNADLCPNVMFDLHEAVGDATYTQGGLAKRLADLIDRPTCRNVADGSEFECSECGMQWNMFDRADALDQWARVRNPSYCPHCGRKVVRDGD